jgi:small subunit ribosomal protein S2
MPTSTTEAKTNNSHNTDAPIPLPELVEMLEAGVHFGHERSKRNPKMESYIFMRRNHIAIFDLEATVAGLQKAVNFVYKLSSGPSNHILFVGTKRQAREVVRKYAESVQQPYVTKRWLGGTLTNFATILKSIEKLEELKSTEGTPAVEKLTKKEKAVRRKEVERLEEVLEGIKNMRALPAAVFVIGSHDEKLAVRESRRMNIPVIGITDTNADPSLITYPIPSNDDAVRAIDLIVKTITKAIAAARQLDAAQARQSDSEPAHPKTEKVAEKK